MGVIIGLTIVLIAGGLAVVSLVSFVRGRRADAAMRIAVGGQVEEAMGYDIGRLVQEQRKA